MEDILTTHERTGLSWFDHDGERHLVPPHMLDGIPLEVGDRIIFGNWSYRVSEIQSSRELPRTDEYYAIQKSAKIVDPKTLRGEARYTPWEDINSKAGVGWFMLGDLERAQARLKTLQDDVKEQKGTTRFRVVRRVVTDMVVAGSLEGYSSGVRCSNPEETD